MSVRMVAILSPGDMGHAVGWALGDHGLDVITCLRGRSERTSGLARAGNIRDVADLGQLVSEADLVLSIIPPAQAVGVARQVAEAIRSARANTFFADCNAVSPETTRSIAGIIDEAGGRFMDASIIGSPPGRGAAPRFYVSGEHASVLADLDGNGIDIRTMGGPIGRASAIKMCYAALTKGSSALYLALLTVAEALGVSTELEAELASSQPEAFERMDTQLPNLPAKAPRWIAEMEEIAATFDKVGVTPDFHTGAAEVYRLLGETPFAGETPETTDRSRTLAQTISAMVDRLAPGAPADG